jgi:hypothetical protein
MTVENLILVLKLFKEDTEIKASGEFELEAWQEDDEGNEYYTKIDLLV